MAWIMCQPNTTGKLSAVSDEPLHFLLSIPLTPEPHTELRNYL